MEKVHPASQARLGLFGLDGTVESWWGFSEEGFQRCEKVLI